MIDSKNCTKKRIKQPPTSVTNGVSGVTRQNLTFNKKKVKKIYQTANAETE